MCILDYLYLFLPPIIDPLTHTFPFWLFNVNCSFSTFHNAVDRFASLSHAQLMQNKTLQNSVKLNQLLYAKHKLQIWDDYARTSCLFDPKHQYL